MKAKWMIAILILVFCLSMAIVACGDDDDDDDDDSRPDDEADDDDQVDDDDDSADDLTWQNPAPGLAMKWQEAMEYCENLTEDDADDWRLPTISELRTLISGCEITEPAGDCSVTDDCTELGCWDGSCDGCSGGEGPDDGCFWEPGTGAECASFWSSTAVSDNTEKAWRVNFSYGMVVEDDVTLDNSVLCVR